MVKSILSLKAFPLFAVLFIQLTYAFLPQSVFFVDIDRSSRKHALYMSAERPLKTPDSVASMMSEVASALLSARNAGVKRIMRVEIPLPVTGGTELDDWPGGIKQKYATLRPLLMRTMQELNFTADAMNARRFLDGAGEDDAVGVWECNGFQLVVFPTPDSIPSLQRSMQWADGSTLLAIVNSQIFLDNFSKKESKDFMEQLEVAYQLESVNSRGPGSLPVRGLIYRKFPGPFQVSLSYAFYYHSLCVNCASINRLTATLMICPLLLLIHFCIYAFIRLFVCLFVCVYVCLFVCLLFAMVLHLKIARRLDRGGYVLLKEFDEVLPSRQELDQIFFDDSAERDKSLSFLDRIKKQVPNFGS